jgi:hypothetical protein
MRCDAPLPNTAGPQYGVKIASYWKNNAIREIPTR